MSIFNQFPYTNVHEMNLDWVIKTVKNALEDVEDVVTEYFADHLDSTLTDPNKAAQADVVGFRLSGVEGQVDAQTLRIDTIEQSLHAGEFYFTLSKSDDTLKYYDVVTSSGDVPVLYSSLEQDIPVRITVNGDPLYRAKISGDDVILYKDVPEYECTIAKNAVQGSAEYVGFVRVNAVSLKYVEGTYAGINQFAKSGRLLANVVLHNISTREYIAPVGSSYSTPDPGTGFVTVTMSFADGSELVFDPDGTISAVTP